jgi:uncharacterized tellurite resistance protein B-like protein
VLELAAHMFSWLKLGAEKKPQSVAESRRAQALYRAVEGAIGSEDEVHVRIVASIAALLLCVAYADSDYSEDEEHLLRAHLARIRGLDEDGVEAIAAVLRVQTVQITGAESGSYARELLELTEEPFRRELLEVLTDLAAADAVITVAETNMMRGITRALGLPQEAYNAAQGRHRDKLAVLSRP